MAKIRPGLGQRDYSAQGKNVLIVEGQHACKLVGDRGLGSNLSGDELTTAARQSQQSNASQDQARQSRTDDGSRDSHAVKHKGRVKRSLASDVGADPQPIGFDTSITVIPCPALEIGKAGRERRSRWNNRPRCGEPEKVPVQ